MGLWRLAVSNMDGKNRKQSELRNNSALFIKDLRGKVHSMLQFIFLRKKTCIRIFLISIFLGKVLEELTYN